MTADTLSKYENISTLFFSTHHTTRQNLKIGTHIFYIAYSVITSITMTAGPDT